MRTAIVYASVHHGNTEKLVKRIAEECQMDLIDAVKQPDADLSSYDMIGFVSGPDRLGHCRYRSTQGQGNDADGLWHRPFQIGLSKGAVPPRRADWLGNAECRPSGHSGLSNLVLNECSDCLTRYSLNDIFRVCKVKYKD